MLIFLINWLENFWHVPAAFTYTSSRMVLAAMSAFLFTVLCGPFCIRRLFALKIGQTIRELDGFLLSELHKNKKNTPTMGGLLILASLVLSLFLWMDLSHPFTYILLLTMLILGSMGMYDDYLKLKHKNHKGLFALGKVLCQVMLSLGIITYFYSADSFDTKTGSDRSVLVIKDFSVKHALHKKNLSLQQVKEESSIQTLKLKEYISRLYMPFFKEPILVFQGVGLFFLGLFLTCVIVGSSNAVNLADGLDGLASGCIIFVAAPLAIVAFLMNNQDIAEYLNIIYVEGSSEVAVFLSSVCGACLGFLWYNGYPAQVFMGDTGSLPLGGIMGVSSVLLRREFLLALIGGIFVVEAISVMMQVCSYRYLNKKRIFKCAPLHHHFEFSGWPETKVVMRFWIIGLILALIGIASLKFQ